MIKCVKAMISLEDYKNIHPIFLLFYKAVPNVTLTLTNDYPKQFEYLGDDSFFYFVKFTNVIFWF